MNLYQKFGFKNIIDEHLKNPIFINNIINIKDGVDPIFNIENGIEKPIPISSVLKNVFKQCAGAVDSDMIYLYYYCNQELNLTDLVKFNGKLLYDLKNMVEDKDGYILINDRKSRIKFGKFILRFYTEVLNRKDLSDKDLNKLIERSVDIYKSVNTATSDNLAVKLFNGSELYHGYDTSKHNFVSGSMLVNSCMNDEFWNIKLYTNNPDKVSIMALIDENGIIYSRCLLWKLDRPKAIFMDRIYSSNDSMNQIFYNIAKNNGWIYRDQKANGFKYTVYKQDIDGDIIDIPSNKVRLSVKLNVKGVSMYPYMDSLFFRNELTGHFSNYVKPFSSYEICHSTSGKRENYFSLFGKMPY